MVYLLFRSAISKKPLQNILWPTSSNQVQSKQSCGFWCFHEKQIASPWHTSILADPEVGGQTADAMGVAFQQWQQGLKWQAMFWMEMHGCHKQNEECLDLHICSNWWIVTRELHIEMNSCFSALKTVQYSKLCTGWVPWTLTQEQKEHCTPISKKQLNQYEAPGVSFLGHHYQWCGVVSRPQARVKRARVHAVATWEFPMEEKVQDTVLSGHNDVHCVLGQERKGWSFWIC